MIQKSASQKRKSSKKISKKVRNKKNANVVKKSQAAKKKSAVKKVAAKKPRKSPVKSKGKVDTYKSVDFSSSISAIQSRGGVKNTEFSDAKVSDSFEKVAESNSNGTADLADVVSEQDSRLADATDDLSSSNSLEGFSDGKSIAVAGIPSKTVVLGGMDPDTIRKILMDHLPQFRFCYQKNLTDLKMNSMEGLS